VAAGNRHRSQHFAVRLGQPQLAVLVREDQPDVLLGDVALVEDGRSRLVHTDQWRLHQGRSAIRIGKSLPKGFRCQLGRQ
jgi:hypothetical protein